MPSCFMLTHLERNKRFAKIPKKYQGCNLNNLPIGEENPKIYDIVQRYCSKFQEVALGQGLGLYLYGTQTGTGKTVTACSILNAFIEVGTWLVCKSKLECPDILGMFQSLSEFQNLYNSQFRTDDKKVSLDYQRTKHHMKHCLLLVLDDIAIRNATETFQNELYEVLNYRDINTLPTIFTSNVEPARLSEYYDYRIVSRISNSTSLKFKGEDHRNKINW